MKGGYDVLTDQQMIVAVKGIIYHKGKVLLLKRSLEEQSGAGEWEIPGGKIEFDEKLEEALQRESKEEIGLDTKVEELLYATTFKTDLHRQIILLVYLCVTKGEEVTLSDEHSEYIWADEEELRLRLPQRIIEEWEENNVFKRMKG
ncbi:NUDIX hydrolase [Evansella cellulosilytica]|uniref:NUDIX hydrolase n=1 Tax=Evansella cellulosilytica (strain ATCC 21833 / DSM 2522 / FERM P-1141 / JCM 9156 / N-4) TaxID=649639 RepID=E6TZD3_EVAC2|nr:NUDIX domain-containing protein [Evansella cellulosilytica]ADU28995.1 NUDIX hydrolase [Evansella cellulosilytica DSM 2522]